MSGLPARIGTLGGGNMAEAILQGLLRTGMEPEQLRAADPVAARREHLQRSLGVICEERNARLVEWAELVVLAVKPQQLAEATADVPQGARPLWLSIVAGTTLAQLRALLGSEARVMRAMPNTPALVGAGVAALAVEEGVDAADLDQAERVLGAVGGVVRVPEPLLDAVTGLSGSGPAYVFLFVEALTDAGVREGLPAPVAAELALRTVRGAAELAVRTGEHPAVLRGRVTSPGGTTAAGLAVLERQGFRGAVLEGVRAATQRSRELGREG